MSRLASGERGSAEITSPIFPGSMGSKLTYGELAALEGLLNGRKPTRALAIGTADRGTVEHLACHAGEVHCFDLATPGFSAPGNVTFHTGDRRGLLLHVLDEVATAGRTVDFALLDAGPYAEDVRRDIEILLNSPATRDTLIVVCEAMSEPVRAGLRLLEVEAWPKVTYVDFNFVAGRMAREESRLGELQGGLGIVVTQADATVLGTRPAETCYFDAFDLFLRARPSALEAVHNRLRLEELTAEIGEEEEKFIDPVAEHERLVSEVRDLEAQYIQLRDAWARTMGSVSWRVTRPLRAVKARFKRLLA